MSAAGTPAAEGALQSPTEEALSSLGRDLLSAPEGASDLELLRTFEPVVRFTSGERFFPMDVDRYVARSSLCLHHPDGTVGVLLGEGELDLETLAQPREYPFGTIEFLRFNDSLDVAEGARALAEISKVRRQDRDAFHPGMGRLARGGFGPRIADALFSLSLLLRGTVPAVSAAAAELEYRQMMQDGEKYVYYGRVVRQGGWTALQYWFFYCYNSWRSGYHGVNDHESDWENVLVYLYEDEGRLYPEWAGYASHDFHGDDLRRRWDDTEQLDLVQGHPVVWAGAGSHASYFQKGEYQAAVALPLPGWVHSMAQVLQPCLEPTSLASRREPRTRSASPSSTTRAATARASGPGRSTAWSPVLVDESTPWVSQYRGLWGLYARDPISGENAPAGPMYDRDGSPRRAWYDPVGFAGLDKEPPPPLAAELLLQDCTRIGLRQEELEHVIAEKATELHALGVQMRAWKATPICEPGTPRWRDHRRSTRRAERAAQGALRERRRTPRSHPQAGRAPGGAEIRSAGAHPRPGPPGAAARHALQPSRRGLERDQPQPHPAGRGGTTDRGTVLPLGGTHNHGGGACSSSSPSSAATTGAP